jgi:hypothetical protein
MSNADATTKAQRGFTSTTALDAGGRSRPNSIAVNLALSLASTEKAEWK